ncbi:IS3 family transposase, partial [Dermacoccus abyssi]
WQAKARAGTGAGAGARPKRPWPTPARDKARDLILKHGTKHSARGHRKIRAMVRHEGHVVSEATVLRTLRVEGLIQPAPDGAHIAGHVVVIVRTDPHEEMFGTVVLSRGLDEARHGRCVGTPQHLDRRLCVDVSRDTVGEGNI